MRMPRRSSREALDKKELSINKGYDLTRQLQDLPEEQREQAAAEALEYEKAKKRTEKAGRRDRPERKDRGAFLQSV